MGKFGSSLTLVSICIALLYWGIATRTEITVSQMFLAAVGMTAIFSWQYYTALKQTDADSGDKSAPVFFISFPIAFFLTGSFSISLFGSFLLMIAIKIYLDKKA